MKIAVILLNMGGPTDLLSVKKFLFNLFYDKKIITLPNPFRFIIAKLMSIFRDKKSQEIYRQIDNKSPIHEITQQQQEALKDSLGSNYEVFHAMRYWGIRAKDVISEIKDKNFEKIILLPLYPHFSSTTTASSLKEWKTEAKKANLNIQTISVGCYFNEPNFINSHINLLIEAIDKSKRDGFANPKVIFSAHGLPEKIIKKGDPYQFQIEETVKQIIKKLNQDIDHIVSYQSRVGPVKWITPYTDQIIIDCSKENQAIIVVPIAFVPEHSETLVELDIEYKELALNNGCPYYLRVSTNMIEENFILSLTNIVRNVERYSNNTHSWQGIRFCGPDKKQCECV